MIFISVVFYLVLFILQIAYFVLAVKKKENYLWKRLFIIETLSIISSIISLICVFIIEPVVGSGLGTIFYFLFHGVFIIIYIVFFIISKITKIIFNKKIKENFSNVNESKENKIYIILIVLITLVINFSNIIPYYNDFKDLYKRADNAIKYLNKKYGDGDFKVKHAHRYDGFLTGNGNYYFEIKSSYLKETFYVSKEMSAYDDRYSDYEDNFIIKYAEEKGWIKEIRNFDLEEEEQIFYGRLPTYNEVLEFLRDNVRVTD